MYGRYGIDQLNIFLMVLSFIFGLVSMFVKGYVDLAFMIAQFMLLTLWALRAFSRNHYGRRKENAVFMKYWTIVKKRLRVVSNFFSRLADRKHKYFKCSRCKSRLRVPRGRGSITITCPRCKNRFDAKS